MKKFMGYGITLALVGGLLFPSVLFAQTNEQLQTLIQSLLAQLQVLQQKLAVSQGTTTWCHTFSSNLKIGQSGSEITALQTALQKIGISITVNASFDDQTASAVSGFQQKYASDILTPNGLTYGTGYVGTATRTKLNALYGCVTALAKPTLPTLPTFTPPAYVPPSYTLPTTPPSSVSFPSLTVSQFGIVQSMVLPGQTSVLVGQYSIRAAASESVKIASVKISVNNSYFRNMKVFIQGHQIGTTQTTVYQGLATFSGEATIVAGTAATVQIFADVSSAVPASSNYSATTFSGCTAYGAMTSASVICNSVDGQRLTFIGSPTNQPTLSASQTTIASGGSATISWSGAAVGTALTGGFGVSCTPGVAMFDVAFNQSYAFSCGDVERNVAASGYYIIKFVNSNTTPTQVTFRLDYGGAQPLTEVITVSPAPTAPSISIVSPKIGDRIPRGPANALLEYKLVNAASLTVPGFRIDLVQNGAVLGSVLKTGPGTPANYYTDPSLWNFSWAPGTYTGSLGYLQQALAGDGFSLVATLLDNNQEVFTFGTGDFSITAP